MKLILIRGLPGSGKSTLAQLLIQSGFYHVETDQYWQAYDIEFDGRKLKEAHEWCLLNTRLLLTQLSNNYSGVVVSNTFTEQWEIQPYLGLAKELGIKPNIYTAQSNFGSIHNVPKSTIQKMSDRFQWWIEL